MSSIVAPTISVGLDSKAAATRLPHEGDKRSGSNPPSTVFEWPNLRCMGLQPGPVQTYRHLPPTELSQYPDKEDIPDELRNILKWSLSRPRQMNASQESQKSIKLDADGIVSSAKETLSQTNSSTSSLTNSNSAIDSPPETLVSSCRPSRASSRSILYERSASVERRISPLRYLKNGILSSTSDLLHSLFSKLDEAGSTTSLPGSPSDPTATITNAKPAQGECASCFEERPLNDGSLTTLSCMHLYCKPCFTAMITTTMQLESAFPPKCCLTEIPLRTIIAALDPTQRTLYKDKAAEYGVPAERRWYCPDAANCGKWINPKKLKTFRINGGGRPNQTCPHCQTKICGTCHGTAHEAGSECPQDFGIRETLELGEDEGWQRCYKCRNMVELTTGCRHMTCRCGGQFCYVCAARWKTCKCTEVDQLQRQTQLRNRRTHKTAQRAIEEEEVAEAIRLVEEMEAQEIVRREEQERREREELARLEQERLREEERRARKREEMEQLRAQLMKESLMERVSFIKAALEAVTKFQQLALISRHEVEESELLRQAEEVKQQEREREDALTHRIEANIEKRKEAMLHRHEQEVADLIAKQESAEDDFFVQIQVHLREKPNREVREQRMRADFEKAQKEEKDKLVKEQQAEAEAFKKNAEMEKEGVHRNCIVSRKEWRHKHEKATRDLTSKISGERHWFEIVTALRTRMLDVHGEIMATQLEGDMEIAGLTEELAQTILPMPDEPLVPPNNQQRAESDKRDSSKEVNTACSGNTSPSGRSERLINELAPRPASISFVQGDGRPYEHPSPIIRVEHAQGIENIQGNSVVALTTDARRPRLISKDPLHLDIPSAQASPCNVPRRQPTYGSLEVLEQTVRDQDRTIQVNRQSLQDLLAEAERNAPSELGNFERKVWSQNESASSATVRSSVPQDPDYDFRHPISKTALGLQRCHGSVGHYSRIVTSEGRKMRYSRSTGSWQPMAPGTSDTPSDASSQSARFGEPVNMSYWTPVMKSTGLAPTPRIGSLSRSNAVSIPRKPVLASPALDGRREHRLRMTLRV